MQKHVNEVPIFQKLLNIKGFTTYEKLLSVALTSLADGETECQPSVKTLARLCGCSPHKIIQVLKSLEAKGYITKIAQFIEAENNAQTVNKYILRFGR
jgi:DNA-binding MarR family transcriptional regulator